MARMRAVLAAVLAMGVAAVGAVPASATTPDGKVVVALLDTGINAGHQEFASDQVVAFWDFTRHLPEHAELWDPDAKPFDDHGHGTGTASMVAARNVSSQQTPSAAPGVKLASAKVVTGDGSVSGDLAAAIRWAVGSVHADVINISIGSIVPVPGAPVIIDVYDAIAEARAAGVLVVVANGNGTANLGLVPGDGASSFYSSSQDVLAVGAADVDGALVSYQPEVAAGYSVTVPDNDTTNGYHATAGTSFASPFVAGFAAKLIEQAHAAGRTLTASRLELLLKYSARDTVMPPWNEGYGVLDLPQAAGAIGHARAGTLPERPDPDPDAAYVEDVAGAERDLNAGEVPGTHDDPGGGAASSGGPAPEPAGDPAPTPTPDGGGDGGSPPPADQTPASGSEAGGSHPSVAALVITRLRLAARAVRLTLSAPARVAVTIRRGARVVRRGRGRATEAGDLRIRLTRRLPAGTYRVTVLATGIDGATSRATRRLRLR